MVGGDGDGLPGGMMARYGCGLCGRYGWNPAYANKQPLCYDCGNRVVLDTQPPRKPVDLSAHWLKRDKQGNIIEK